MEPLARGVGVLGGGAEGDHVHARGDLRDQGALEPRVERAHGRRTSEQATVDFEAAPEQDGIGVRCPGRVFAGCGRPAPGQRGDGPHVLGGGVQPARRQAALAGEHAQRAGLGAGERQVVRGVHQFGEAGRHLEHPVRQPDQEPHDAPGLVGRQGGPAGLRRLRVGEGEKEVRFGVEFGPEPLLQLPGPPLQALLLPGRAGDQRRGIPRDGVVAAAAAERDQSRPVLGEQGVRGARHQLQGIGAPAVDVDS